MSDNGILFFESFIDSDTQGSSFMRTIKTFLKQKNG